MQRATGLEIYISRAPSPGLGGQLMAKKVTPGDRAQSAASPPAIDLRSPSRHPDVLGADDLVIKVEEFREATGYRKPVSVKLGAGRVATKSRSPTRTASTSSSWTAAGLDRRPPSPRGAGICRHPHALRDPGGGGCAGRVGGTKEMPLVLMAA